MGGGLMQLVAYGAQDIYLTGNPQITFFKVVYRRHTNFSMEAIQQTFNGQVGFDRRVTTTISRNGDLIHRMYLQVTLNGFTAAAGQYNKGWCDYVGHALIKNVEVEIGGQRIDKHYGEWLHIWNELTQCPGKKAGYNIMIGEHVAAGGTAAATAVAADAAELAALKAALVAIDYERINATTGAAAINATTSLTAALAAANAATITLFNAAIVAGLTDAQILTAIGNTNGHGAAAVTAVKAYKTAATTQDTAAAAAQAVPATTLYIPLQFWFCRNPGLALPLIALQYHEVKLNLEFNSLANCLDPANTGIVASMPDAVLYVDYIYLDTDERRRFAQVSHEYLIEQLQFTGDATCDTGSNKFKLDFNHPTKELIWVTRTYFASDENYWFNFTDDGAHSTLDGAFIGKNTVETALLQLNGHDRFSVRDGSYFDLVQPYQHHENVPEVHGINVYSFALKPEEHQPSGSCNFSRIDNAILQVNSLVDGTTKIFAVNYNVLRIMSGMGGLAYSN